MNPIFPTPFFHNDVEMQPGINTSNKTICGFRCLYVNNPVVLILQKIVFPEFTAVIIIDYFLKNILIVLLELKREVLKLF